METPSRRTHPTSDFCLEFGGGTKRFALPALDASGHVSVPPGGRITAGGHPHLPSIRTSLPDASSHEFQHNLAETIMDRLWTEPNFGVRPTY